jgi:hypothetical protein
MSAIDLRSATLNSPAAVVSGGITSPVQSTRPLAVLDEFSARAGADVSYHLEDSYAVFQYDADKRRVQVAVYNGDGQLIRMIPPGSVSQMIAAMSAYRPARR